jgi:hypothetical protein
MLVLFFFGTEQEDLLKLKKKKKTRISIDPLCPTHADI